MADGTAHERRLTRCRARPRGGECDRLVERIGGGAAGGQEAVAANLLAPLDQFQQEAGGAQRVAQQQIGADRRQQVGGQCADDAGLGHVVVGKRFRRQKSPPPDPAKGLSEERMPLCS